MNPYWYPLSVPTIGDAEIDAVNRVLRSGYTTMGAETAAFEYEFAHAVGAQHAVMVNSGSSADLLIAMGLRESGGEVLVPAVTWPTQVWAWVMAGFKVTLVDVDPATLNAGIDDYAAAVTPDTTVLSLTHLMGNTADLNPILDLAANLGLIVTEDCCEALGAKYHGAPVGSFGHAAAWSFFFSHQMTTMEGGMVTTDDLDFADKLRGLRSHGWTRHVSSDLYTFAGLGFNLRPTEVQAAIGRVQLKKLRRFNEMRHRAFLLFESLVDTACLTAPQVVPGACPSWFGLPLLVDDRDGLAAHLEAHGVETRPILGGNLARQPVARAGHFTAGDLPGADYIHDRGLFIGLHPSSTYDVERLAGLVNAYAKVAA